MAPGPVLVAGVDAFCGAFFGASGVAGVGVAGLDGAGPPPTSERSAEVAPGDKSFVRKDEIFTMTDEPGHQDLCDREQEFFLRAINEDIDLSDSMDAAVNSLRIVLAAEQSINEKRVVELA